MGRQAGKEGERAGRERNFDSRQRSMQMAARNEVSIWDQRGLRREMLLARVIYVDGVQNVGYI